MVGASGDAPCVVGCGGCSLCSASGGAAVLLIQWQVPHIDLDSPCSLYMTSMAVCVKEITGPLHCMCECYLLVSYAPSKIVVEAAVSGSRQMPADDNFICPGWWSVSGLPLI